MKKQKRSAHDVDISAALLSETTVSRKACIPVTSILSRITGNGIFADGVAVSQGGKEPLWALRKLVIRRIETMGNLARSIFPLPPCRKINLSRFFAMAFAAVMATPASADSFTSDITFDGGCAVSNSFSCELNWSPISVPDGLDNLFFEASGTADNDLDTVGSNINSLTFNLASGSMTITGNQLDIGVGGITNLSGNEQTINTPIRLLANQTWEQSINASDGEAKLVIGGVNLNGKTLTYDGIASATSQIWGDITGSGSLVMAGGTLRLSGDNLHAGNTTIGGGTLILDGGATYTGNTTIAGGTLKLGSGNHLSSGAAVFVDTDGTFDLNGFGEGIGALSGNGTVKLGSNNNAGLILNQDSNTLFSGKIQGTGNTSLTKRGAGILELQGINSYTGATRVEEGTLQVTGLNRINRNSKVFVGTGGTLQLKNVTGISGSIQTIAELSGSGEVKLGFGELTVDQDTNATFSGNIRGAGSLVKQGNGVLSLGGANTYTGNTTIEGGQLWLLDNDRISDASAVTLSNTAGIATAALFLNDFSETIGGLSGDGEVALGQNNDKGLTVDQDTDTVFSGIIQGGTSGGTSLTKKGTGTLKLRGFENTYTGATRIEAGTVDISRAPQLGFGGKLVFDGGTLRTTYFLPNPAPTNISMARSIELEGNGQLDTGDFTRLILSGNISGNGFLAKSGAGTLVLTNDANSYGGGTSISDGRLVISADRQLGIGGLLTFAGGNLQTTADIETNRSTFLFADFNDVGAFVGAFSTDAGTTLTHTGLIHGRGTLTKSGDGTLTLSGANTYEGATRIVDGTLQISADNQLGNGGPLVFFSGLNGGTLKTTADIETDRLTEWFSRGGRFDTDGGTTLTHNGEISGEGDLIKKGAGTLKLTNSANSYGGSTRVLDGTLEVSDGGGVSNALDTFVGQNSSSNGSFNILTGGTVDTNRNGFIGFAGNSTGSVTVGGTNSRWDVANGLYVGGGVAANGGTGTLTVSNGGTVNVGSDLTVWNANSSISTGTTADLTGGVVDVAGVLTLTGGGKATGFFGFVGGAGTVATNSLYVQGGATVTGTGSEWTTRGMRVGQNGAGTLTVANVGKVSSTGSLEAGTSSGSNGVINVRSGGAVEADAGSLGVFAGSTGAVTVGGSNSRFDVTNGLYVGGKSNASGGAGTLTASDGGTVNVGSDLTVWNANSSISTGTTDAANGQIYVAGELKLTGGGTASSYTGIVDDVGTGLNNRIEANTATITGVGSRWDTGFFTSGFLGTGMTTVSDGGVVSSNGDTSVGAGPGSNGTLDIINGGMVDTNGLGYIGVFPSATGTVTVGGANAWWDVANDLYIGGSAFASGGTGTLTVNDGGTVTAGTVKVWSTSAVNLNGGDLRATTIDTTSPGAQFNFTGGTLAVDTFNGDLVNQGGILAPGNSPGVTNIIGDYSQDFNSTLLIEIGGLLSGTEYDVLDITGTASLAGTLDVNFYDLGGGLFDASLGDTFDILMAEELTGSFNLWVLAALGGGLDWDLSYLTDEIGSTDVVRLSVVSAVPVPAAAWLFGSGLITLIGLGRRKKAA